MTACSVSTLMRVTWMKTVVCLGLLILLLQLLHVLLLSAVDRVDSERANRERSLGSPPEGECCNVTSPGRPRTDMVRRLARATVVDASGTFFIVADLALADDAGNDDGVTLVTQASVDKLHHLPALARRWAGPASVAAFARDAGDVRAAVDAVVAMRRCFPDVRSNVSFHLVFPVGTSPPVAVATAVAELPCERLLQGDAASRANYAGGGVAYPANLLRNVARRGVDARARHVLVVDIDLLPSAGLRGAFSRLAAPHPHAGALYVVPAFEARAGASLAATKRELRALVAAGDARPFYAEPCPECQSQTDNAAWLHASDAAAGVLHDVAWRHPYEPFFVVDATTAAGYDERFRAYGYNRVSLLCELHAAGYEMSVLADAFLLHKGFKTLRHDDDDDYARNRRLYAQFRAEIRERYPNSTRIC